MDERERMLTDYRMDRMWLEPDDFMVNCDSAMINIYMWLTWGKHNRGMHLAVENDSVATAVGWL
jgi:hypothetical protein